MFNHHPPYNPNLAPSDFHLFLQLKKFLSGQRQRFQTDREVEMSVIVVPVPGERLLRHRIQNWSHGMANVSIPEVKSVAINLSIKFGFVSVNCPRETYFVDALRIYNKLRYNFTSDCHPRGPGFDSRLYPRNFSGSIVSGTGSTQPREDNWVATYMRSSGSD